MSALPAEFTKRIVTVARECRDAARVEANRLVLVLRLDTNDVNAWHGLGVALARLGDRAAAFVALRNALLRDAHHGPSQLALGELLFDCGQVEVALRCFESAARARDTLASSTPAFP